MFNNEVKVEWLDDPRKMILLEDIEFTDPNGKVWLASENSIIDGASIPKPLWVIMGSPFIGLYRRASVLHDVYCSTKSEPYKEVNKMFYDGMIQDEVSKTKARMMYNAVKIFGPKW